MPKDYTPPPGFVLVPATLTPEMREAMERHTRQSWSMGRDDSLWADVLAAAPKQ